MVAAVGETATGHPSLRLHAIGTRRHDVRARGHGLRLHLLGGSDQGMMGMIGDGATMRGKGTGTGGRTGTGRSRRGGGRIQVIAGMIVAGRWIYLVLLLNTGTDLVITILVLAFFAGHTCMLCLPNEFGRIYGI